MNYLGFFVLYFYEILVYFDVTPFWIYGFAVFLHRFHFYFVDGFTVAKAFSFMQSHLFIFGFVTFAFVVKSKNQHKG